MSGGKICSDGSDGGHAELPDAAASTWDDLDGVCVPDAGFDAVLEGVREEIVWLSRVKRRDVMITWGT